MDDINLRLEFHQAIDAVGPLAPWLVDDVRQDLRRRLAARPRPRRQSRLALIWTPAITALLAALLILALAAAAVGVALALHQLVRHTIPVIPYSSGPVSRGCGGQGGIYMVDANIGWEGSAKTTDGGKTWQDTLPPMPGVVKGPQAMCALDASRAWVVVSTGSVPYQPKHLVIVSTRDGGQSWQQAGDIAVPFATDWHFGFSVELSFFDDQNGWLLMEYSSTPFVRLLYATADGGAHWAVVSRAAGLGLGRMAVGCSESGMMFFNPQRGWLTWSCESGPADQPPQSGPVIAGTTDGGRTWAPLILDGFDPAGRLCGTTTPIFSRDQGVLQVTCAGLGQPAWSAIYSTADGGQNWTVHALPVIASVDFVDGTTGFFFHLDANGNSLYRTTDGGGVWTVVASGLFPGNQINSFKFLDASTGSVNASNSPVPWSTRDGGKTWSLPGPNRIVGTVVCTLPADAGAGAVPIGLKMVSPTVGWAAGARRTADGGATWSRVGPPQAKDSTSGYGEFFLDAKHAWVAEAVGSSTACADHFVVFSTADGGLTWKQGVSVPVQKPRPDLMGDWRIWLDFVDPDHGWMRIVAGTQPLYRTLDGGRHWTVVAASTAFSRVPFSYTSVCRPYDASVFSSPTTGWIGAQCGNGPNYPLALLVTRDAGATWSVQTVAQKSSGGGTVPAFFDAQNGWLFDPNLPLLTMTSDGGQTWIQKGLPALPGFACTGKHGENMTCTDQAFSAASFIDPSQGWVIISRYDPQKGMVPVRFERTQDGGKTWTPLSSNGLGTAGFYGPSPPRLTFVDQENGFQWTGSDLVSTKDGGQTWTAVQMTYR